MKTKVSTEALGDLPELLSTALASDPELEPLTWVRGEEGMVAFGIYKQVEVRGAHRFEDAKRWWQEALHEFEIHNNVNGSGTGPILFASFSFDPDEPSLLVIPKVVVGKRSERRWITWIGDAPQPQLISLEKEPDPLSMTWSGENGEAWRDHVAKIVDLIQEGEAEKVVLARSLDGRSEKKIET